MTYIPRATEQRQAITRRLALERIMRGLTQTEVAEQIGAQQCLVTAHRQVQAVDAGDGDDGLEVRFTVAGDRRWRP